MRKAIAAIFLTIVSLGSQAGERSYEKLYRNLPVEMQQPEQPHPEHPQPPDPQREQPLEP